MIPRKSTPDRKQSGIPNAAATKAPFLFALLIGTFLVALPVRVLTTAPAAPIQHKQSAASGDVVGSLLLSADALVISANGGTALITAIARDTAGQPVAGAKVHFQGPAGALSPANATTGVDGVAKSTFTASSAPGQAIITAETGGLTQQTRLQMNSLQQDETANTLHLELDAVELDPGQQMPITATLLNGSGQPISGTLVTLFGSLGAVSPASALSDENGRVAATFSAGNVPGEARVSILAGYASISAVLQVIEATTGDHFIYLPLITKGPFILQHGSQLDNGLSG